MAEVEQQVTRMIVKDTTSNPAPLGLFGFGMTTVLLNLHNAGFFQLSTMILGMGIFYGGIAQIIAGVMEWKKNNTFGAVAFTSYGSFWLTLVALLVLPAMGWGVAPEKGAMVAYFIVWGLFTLFLFVGTLRLNRALQVVFGTLVLLFLLLALRDATGSAVVGKLAGYEGILCGASAIYTAVAQVWNEVYGREVLPLCPVKK